ncbi:MAG: aldo/keto reductase [Caldilineae bacterium]|nr:aldo/keto reductase [Caldilineae bacterium]
MQTETENITLRPLGQTGIQISPVGMGVMEFSGGGGLIGRAFPVIAQETKNAIVQAALEGGITWFDTAEMYGMGESERSLAAALHTAGKSDDDVVVATKWLPLLRTAGNIPKTIDDRLRELDGYSIDLYQVHQPWSFSSPEEEMNAMADLVEAGKIRSVGVSNFGPQAMRRASRALRQRGLTLASNQVKYSLLDRKIEHDGTLDTARELGATIIAYTPLESGLLTGKYHQPGDPQSGALAWRKWMIRRNLERTRPLIEALEEIGRQHDATPAQVALNWLINFHGDLVVVIPGATKVYQAQQNAGAMAFRLSDAEMARLDELSRRV